FDGQGINASLDLSPIGHSPRRISCRLRRGSMRAPDFCHRCSTPLTRGDGSCWIIRIEAFADPEVNIAEPTEDPSAEIARLIAAAAERSEAELMDDVRRRLTITLCEAC